MSSRVMFLRQNYGSGNTNPVGCVAIELTETTKGTKPSRDIRYQISVLNPVDRFNREVARQLARGRLLEKPYLISNISAKLDMNLVTNAVMNDIVLNPEAPMRARKAAASWLGYPNLKQCVNDMIFVTDK